MIEKLSIRWFYAIGLAFLALVLTGVYFEILYLAALPLVFVFLWLLSTQTRTILLLTIFAVPLSIPVNDVGGGLGMSFPTEPIIILLFFGILLKLINGYTFDKCILTNSLTLIILLDLLWNFNTSLFSSMPVVSFKFLISRFWYVLIFFFVLTNLFKKPENIRIFIWLLGISVCILAT